MNDTTVNGGLAPGADRAGRARERRSGTPESRPQLEELRSGEWVTEPGARGAVFVNNAG